MAIAIGNKTFSNSTPGAAFFTISHNQNTGSDRTILAVVTMSNTVNFGTATYDGVTMNTVRNKNFSGMGQRQCTYVLQAPSTGSNTFRVNFTGNQWNNISISIISFTGAGNYGNEIVSGGVSTPNSQSLTIAANSIIYATGVSVNAQSSGYLIGGSTRTNLFAHNTNRQVEGALSATGLAAGAQNVTTVTDFGNITNYRIEITEAGGTPPVTSSGNFLLMF